MTTAVLIARQSGLLQKPLVQGVVLLFGVMVTAAAAVAGNGNVIIAVVPVLLAILAYLFVILPVRYTVFALIFLSLSLDSVGEGPWNSPLAPIGSLLVENLNKSIPLGALKFQGYAIALAAMLALLTHRNFVGSQTDSHGRTQTALPLFGALVVSFGSVIALVLWGKSHGGDLQMAKIQVQNYLFLLVMTYVAAMSLRDMRDYRILGRILIAAAVIRSFYVLYAAHVVTPLLEPGKELAVASTHGDSLVFSMAMILLIVRFMEQPSRRIAGICMVLIPLILLAMHVNNRRLVWVELAMGFLAFAVLSQRSRVKRILVNCALVMLPFMVAYVAVGWNSQSKIFAPVQTYRSVTDGQVDSSTLYRDLENFNLMQTMRVRPLFGVGFGQPFIEIAKLPDISFVFKEYQYVPHNAILGLWAYTGVLGFTGIFLTLVTGVYFAMRSYRHARTADERIAAIMPISMVLIYLMHCWGDIGFSERRAIFLLGPALAIAGQLATRTGAYRGTLASARAAAESHSPILSNSFDLGVASTKEAR